MKAPLDPKRTISTRLETGHYKRYQSRSPTPVWGFVWPCKGYLSIWPHNPIGHNENVVPAWRGVCNVSHWIGENVPSAIYVKTPLNKVDAF